MESGEQRTARRVDRKFVGWHVFYTAVLTAWGLLFVINNQDFGSEPGYWVLALGALPSLAMLGVGCIRPAAGYVMGLVYGAIVAVGVAILVVTTPNMLWMVVSFPLFAFIVEAVVLQLRRPVLFRQRPIRADR